VKQIIASSIIEVNQERKQHAIVRDMLWNNTLLDESQRRSLYILWMMDEPMSREERGRLWLVATGALDQMLCHKDYYQSLLKTKIEYPNPSFHQIDLDLTRTFVDMEVDKEEEQKMILPLKNVLYTYVKRNPTIGYCQGMNFIVGRMIQFMDEEEAFWTLTMILETILPLDFYCNMVGALVDQ
jgi:Rab-GTPase-TBC domain